MARKTKAAALNEKKATLEAIVDEGLFDYPEELRKRLTDAFPDERVEVEYDDREGFICEVGGLRAVVPRGRVVSQSGTAGGWALRDARKVVYE